jgi:hypothetical protein
MLAELGQGTQLDKLIIIIHSPGWTTTREVAFSAALVDSLTAHTSVLAKTHKALVQSAKTRSVSE